MSLRCPPYFGYPARPPEDWRTREPKAEEVAGFQKQVREAAQSFANKAREFIERFPTNENVGDARITVVHALTHAVAAGTDCIAAGNLLRDRDVPAAMARAFAGDVSLHLAERLLRGLEAGLAAGGEMGPVKSAGLLVVHEHPWPLVDLRVDTGFQSSQ